VGMTNVFVVFFFGGLPGKLISVRDETAGG
jgi:hypothetical protein